jgi:hypothetical protein
VEMLSVTSRSAAGRWLRRNNVRQRANEISEQASLTPRRPHWIATRPSIRISSPEPCTKLFNHPRSWKGRGGAWPSRGDLVDPGVAALVVEPQDGLTDLVSPILIVTRVMPDDLGVGANSPTAGCGPVGDQVWAEGRRSGRRDVGTRLRPHGMCLG